MDQATVKMTALQVIFDLLHLFGLDTFNVDAAAESTEDETSGNEEGKDSSRHLVLSKAVDMQTPSDKKLFYDRRFRVY